MRKLNLLLPAVTMAIAISCGAVAACAQTSACADLKNLKINGVEITNTVSAAAGTLRLRLHKNRKRLLLFRALISAHDQEQPF